MSLNNCYQKALLLCLLSPDLCTFHRQDIPSTATEKGFLWSGLRVICKTLPLWPIKIYVLTKRFIKILHLLCQSFSPPALWFVPLFCSRETCCIGCEKISSSIDCFSLIGSWKKYILNRDWTLTVCITLRRHFCQRNTLNLNYCSPCIHSISPICVW